MTSGPASQEWARLESDREEVLNRAEACARLTIPSLLPERGHAKNQDLPQPWQSFGARGVNSMASKLNLALYPPTQSFFELRVSEADAEALGGVSGEAPSEVRQTLQAIEDEIATEMAAQSYRDLGHSAFLHLIVTGNVLQYMPDQGGMELFPLNLFVLERAPDDTLLKIIIREKTHVAALTEDVRSQIAGKTENEEELDVYHYFKYQPAKSRGKKGTWTGFTEICGEEIAGTQGKWREDRFPYRPLRWQRVEREAYGRGHVEMHYGDLKSYDALSQALIEGAAAAARYTPMRRPNATGSTVKQLNQLRNGEWGLGNEEDYWVFRVDKTNDMAVAANVADTLRRELGQGFLLQTSVQRDAERVTAEEVRRVSQELESALSGTFTILRNEYQRPLVDGVMRQLRKAGRIPKLPDEVKIVIVTGLEALGRGQEFEKMNLAAQAAVATLGPEQFGQYINPGEWLNRLVASVGIKNPESLLRSAEELAQIQQQAQLQSLAEKVGPEVVRQVGNQSAA